MLVLAAAQLFALGMAAPVGAAAVASEQGPDSATRVRGFPFQLEDGARAADTLFAPSDSFGQTTGTMRVQIDMFSGRPNPTWEITVQEADQVRAAFRLLPERSAAARPDRLGYRGLIVQGDGVRDLGLTRILIGGGVVIAEGFQGVRYLADADRSLERQIFQTGRTRLDPTDYAAFRSIAFP